MARRRSATRAPASPRSPDIIFPSRGGGGGRAIISPAGQRLVCCLFWSLHPVTGCALLCAYIWVLYTSVLWLITLLPAPRAQDAARYETEAGAEMAPRAWPGGGGRPGSSAEAARLRWKSRSSGWVKNELIPKQIIFPPIVFRRRGSQ